MCRYLLLSDRCESAIKFCVYYTIKTEGIARDTLFFSGKCLILEWYDAADCSVLFTELSDHYGVKAMVFPRVVDISGKMKADSSYVVTAEDVRAYEAL